MGKGGPYLCACAGYEMCLKLQAPDRLDSKAISRQYAIRKVAPRLLEHWRDRAEFHLTRV